MLYEEYIQSEIWQEKRIQRLDIDKYECRLCGSKENLQVHHKPNSYKKIPNESVENDLTTVCETCHELITNKIRQERHSKTTIVFEAHQNNIRKGLTNENKSTNIELPPHRRISTNSP